MAMTEKVSMSGTASTKTGISTGKSVDEAGLT